MERPEQRKEGMRGFINPVHERLYSAEIGARLNAAFSPDDDLAAIFNFGEDSGALSAEDQASDVT